MGKTICVIGNAKHAWFNVQTAIGKRCAEEVVRFEMQKAALHAVERGGFEPFKDSKLERRFK